MNMKQRLALIASVTLTVSILVSLQGVDLVSANYLPPPSIEISSPTSIKVYTEPSVQLYFRVNALTDKSSDIVYVRYCLDGKANVTLTDLSREDGLSYWAFKEGGTATGNGFTVNTTMTNLSEGKHTVVVYSHAADGTEMSRTIEFTVDYDYVSPQNPFGLPSFPMALQRCPLQSLKDLKYPKLKLRSQQQISDQNQIRATFNLSKTT
jgi:hypothetical protein